MHRLALWCKSNKKESNRGNDQDNLTDDREDCDQRVAAEQKKVQSSGKHGAGRQCSRARARALPGRAPTARPSYGAATLLPPSTIPKKYIFTSG
jgi:hypothetical protein